MPANIHLLPPLLIPQNPALSDQPDPPNEVSVLSSPLLLLPLIALGFYLFCTSSVNRFDEILHEDKHSEALAALMAIFTPTKSSWPSDVLDATRRAAASRLGRDSVPSVGSPSSGIRKGEIRLGFSAVYEHILNGDLELQPTASVDLVKAILLERDGMDVDGWKIKVVVEWKWIWRVSLWIMRGLGPRLVNLSELWNDDAQKISHLLERARVPSRRLIYTLDFLPTHEHDRFAGQLYTALRSGRLPSPDRNGEGETRALVTFSAISAPSVLLSTITLCGLPFFLRTPPAEPTPVLLGLRRAVKSLSSVSVRPCAAAEEGRFVVISIEDNSKTYAGALVETIKQMEGDADFRQRLVDESGVRGWRRGMFCLELEAALYKAGLMKRWEVLVSVS